MSQSQLPSGFIEYSLSEEFVFDRILKQITEGYQMSGFTPLDTTAIGYSEVLLAKAGGDLDKEIYRFTKGSRDLSLRFDLTVPMARFMAEHYQTLSKPVRVYQIGKVWRAEKPQKGRYRELYQADIDILGDDSRLAEAEIIATMNRIFESLQLPQAMFRISNRKILTGLLEFLEVQNSTEALRVIDKFEKRTEQEWKSDMQEIGLTEETITTLYSVLTQGVAGSNLIDNELYQQGLQELLELEQYLQLFGVSNYRIDISIVRGQDYYTGTVFETQLQGLESMGSICSGGRYDNLISAYSPNIRMTGFGASIGVSRLFGILRETDWIQSQKIGLVPIVLACLTQESQSIMIETAQSLRMQGIAVLVYPQVTDFGTVISFANKQSIPYLGMFGADEAQGREVLLKNLETREQEIVPLEELSEKLQ